MSKLSIAYWPARGLTAGMLLLALLAMPYGYFVVLRWMTCAVTVFLAFRAREQELAGWTWVLTIVALLFNPLLPVGLDRATWRIVDLAVAVLLLVLPLPAAGRQ